MATDYEAVIGLEVHAQLLTRTKLFCGCSTAFGAAPNTQVCPVCLGLPGALPVPNAHAVELAVRAGIALGCEVQRTSRFARKNYFYPDLAKGYQISQFDQPINLRGAVEFAVEGGEGSAPRCVQLQRIHMEEDAAKNLHDVGDDTLVDFNRAGVPLIEIVSEPELRSAVEAEAYLRRLHATLMFARVNDGNLEEGSFRCDANVSIRPRGATILGTRVELKNINSFRFVRRAIEHEIARQVALVSGGGRVTQETRTWSEAQGKTLPMRTKEEADDYRYFPDPDLPPLVVDDGIVLAVRRGMPELPEAKRARFVEALGLTAYDAMVLTGHPGVAGFFEDTLAVLCPSGDAGQAPEPPQALQSLAKQLANFVQAEVLRHVTLVGLEARLPVLPSQVASLIGLVNDGTINGKIAKDVFARMVETGRAPAAIVAAENLGQMTDDGAIEAVVRSVLAAHPSQLAGLRAGKETLMGFFVGQVMKATRGAANPKLVNETLRRLIGEPS